jgi:hypothetical protein
VARDDDEVAADEAVDELQTYFAGKQPKILLTTNQRPSKVPVCCWMFDSILNNVYYYYSIY